MKKLSLAILGAAFLATTAIAAPQGFSSPNNGQSFGPQGFNNTVNSVAAIKANGYDDQVVALRGRLTNYLGQDRYEFTDEAGDRIEVELDDDYNWSNIAKDQLIEIVGEIDKDLLSTTIDVKRATPLE